MDETVQVLLLRDC